MSFSFKILKKSPRSKARVGKLITAHGEIDTPCFMPVGTQGTVKTMSPRELLEVGAQIILGNTYHLYLRPGPGLIAQAGGLHRFINWNKPILTDSGGFQVFSLSHMRRITDEGVEFTSHIDGSKHFFTPGKVVEIQTKFGSDIIMPLDECVPYPCSNKQAEEAVHKTTEWAKISKSEIRNSKQIQNSKSETGTLFGIVQGGTYLDLRKRSAKEIGEIGFPGFGIGGLSVGEEQGQMFDMLDAVTDILPENTPKHLMGVGYADDILGAVDRGADMFDCVIPTRLARHGSFLTMEGKRSIRLKEFEKDFSPIDPECDCYACRTFTKAYLRHLFWAREITALHMLTIHNIRFLMRMMEKRRAEVMAE